jgi:hypothetical protein
MAVPFDPRALRVVGEPQVIEPGVAPQRVGPSVALSREGTLVSLPPVSPLSRLVLADADGRAITIGEPRAFDSARLSSDGRRIAVASSRTTVWTSGLLDRGTAAATRVTRNAPRSRKLESWSADNKSLIHTRDGELLLPAVAMHRWTICRAAGGA